MKRITVEGGQTIHDLAMQYYGCRQGVFILVRDNGFGLTTELQPGQSVLIRDEVPQLTDKNIAIATQLSAKVVVVNTSYKRELQSGESFYSDGFYSTTFYN